MPATLVQIGEHIKGAWAAYAALSVIALNVIAFAGLPGRVSALEGRMDRTEILNRYTGCVLKAAANEVDPRPCESHLSPDVIEYLRPQRTH